MPAYTLYQILEDRSLRASLADESFVFEDGNGVFTLDFEALSIRRNHRAAFDRLYELGGDELFEKLLADGSTCLTDDPNAAKQGVRPIEGSDRFFLKTNAGDPTAIASILHGILGWAETHTDFDAELVTLTVGGEDIVDDEDEELSLDCWYHDGESVGFGAPRSCTPMQEPGSSIIRLFDKEAKEYIPVPDGNGGVVADLFACEKLIIGDAVAYKYRLEENGKWGYISPKLGEITEPCFEDILATDNSFDNHIIAWYETPKFSWGDLDDSELEDSEPDNINIRFSFTVTHNPSGEEDVWLQGSFFSSAISLSDVSRSYTPTEYAEIRHDSESDITFYHPHSGSKYALVVHPLPGTMPIKWDARFEDGKLVLTHGDMSYSTPADKDAMFTPISACRRAFEPQDCGFEIVDCLAKPESGVGVYSIRKDGWYAIAKLYVGDEIELRELLTPYAFTAIDSMGINGFARVDRFGRQGVFALESRSYVVPCEYEVVTRSAATGNFLVRRAGFFGEIDRSGSWVEHLHREEA